jgi:hypothetical protein
MMLGSNYYFTYPETAPKVVPSGQFLVHNRVKPAKQAGTRGFRFWLQSSSDKLVQCDCKWAPESGAHYRVQGVRPFGGENNQKETPQ